MKFLGEPSQRFGMAKEKKARWSQNSGESRDRQLRSLGDQVHDDVAAKDEIILFEFPASPIFHGEIALLEGDHGANTFVENEVLAVLLEILIAYFRRGFSQGPAAILGALRFR